MTKEINFIADYQKVTNIYEVTDEQLFFIWLHDFSGNYQTMADFYHKSCTVLKGKVLKAYSTIEW